MIEKIKRFKKIEIILVISLVVLFFLTNANIINYGLPFFQQEDEGAFLKSTISFISFITGIKSEMSDPFFGSLLNLLLTLKLLFLLHPCKQHHILIFLEKIPAQELVRNHPSCKTVCV